MISVKCLNCSVSFLVKPSWLKNGYGKYCSRNCSSSHIKNGAMFQCHTCNQPVYRSKKDQEKSKSGKYFCSKSCQTIWRNSELHVGSKHPNWVNGKSSYRDTMRRSGQLQQCSRCAIDDIRILSIHHKDRNRDNNEISNLIFMCHNCHFLVHKYKEESPGYITA